MATTLQSGRNAELAPCFALTHQGHLIITDGINQNRIWKPPDSATFKLGMDAPTVAPTVTTPGGGNAEAGEYVCYYRDKYTDGTYSEYTSLSPVATVTAVANDEFSWSISAPIDSRTTHRELWRSLVNDSASVFLVTTLTVGSTTYTDTFSDAALATHDSEGVDNTDGSSNMNRFAPPPCKRFCVPFYDRYVYLGDVIYNTGSVELTGASASVVGRGTNWTSEMVGRKFYVPGQATEYTILAVGSATALTLSVVYAGTTNLFSAYSIRPHKNERRKIYFTPPLEFYAVRPSDNILPSDQGEDYTGGMALRGMFFAFEPYQIWRLSIGAAQGRVSANNKPSVVMQHVSSRGLANHRCVVKSDDYAYVLDQDGVYIFDGNGVKDIGQPIQDQFNLINWAAKEWFFAEEDSAEQVIRFHVSLGESYLPTHVLVYHTEQEQWHVEELHTPLGAAVLADISGAYTSICGGEAGKFFIREGTLDGTTERTIHGTATAATALTLADTSPDAVLPSSVVGTPVSLVAGPGNGQRRIIVGLASGVMTIDRPWYEMPTTDTVYQVGGVQWRAKGGIYQFPNTREDSNTARRVVVVAEPTTDAAEVHVRHFTDHNTEPDNYIRDQDMGTGVTLTRGKPDARCSLKKVQAKGTFSGRRVWDLWGYVHDSVNSGRFSQVEMRGVQGPDRIRVYRLVLEGRVVAGDDLPT